MTGRRQPRRTVAALVAVSVIAVGGIVLIGQLRNPPEELVAVPTTGATVPTVPGSSTTTPEPTTTTTPRIAIEETGTPFEWLGVLEVENSVPVGLVKHDDSFFLFTSEPTQRQSTSIWTSVDGIDWTFLGPVAEDFELATASSTPFGLVAVGTAPSSGSAVAWRSEDGLNWNHSLLSKGRVGVEWIFYQTVVAADIVVVKGGFYRDNALLALVQDAMSVHLGYDVADVVFYDWELSSASHVTALGPFGIPVYQTNLEAIGLTPADLAPHIRDPSEGPNTAWITRDGSTWREVVGGQWDGLNSLFAGEDGRVWGQTWSFNEGPGGLIATADGVTWELVEELTGQPATVTGVVHSAGVYMGDSITGMPAVAMSGDGITWRQINLGGLLGHTPAWQPTSKSAGPAGIAIVVNSDSFFGVWPQPGVEWAEDPWLVRISPSSVEVYRDGELVQASSTGSFASELPARYDAESGALTLLDPTGGELVTLTLEDITGLEAAMESMADPETALLFADASTWPTPGVFEALRLPRDWTIQDLRPVTDDPVTHILVDFDRVIMVAGGPQRTEVFVAMIPGAS